MLALLAYPAVNLSDVCVCVCVCDHSLHAIFLPNSVADKKLHGDVLLYYYGNMENEEYHKATFCVGI